MPTYAQLEAEPWWGREIVTPEVRWLGQQLCAAFGVPASAFGAKGDRYHLRGAHRSQEWILNSRYCTNRTYTVQSGLTADQKRLIAGVDFSPGSRARMAAISANIDRACRAGQLEEVREWYGNLGGDSDVDGWNNIENRFASSDSSHLDHLHGTLDRRVLRAMAVMRRILAAILTGTTTIPSSTQRGDDMLPFFVKYPGDAQVFLCDSFMTNRRVTGAEWQHLRDALVANGGSATIWEWPEWARGAMGVAIDSIDDPDQVSLTDAQLADLGALVVAGLPTGPTLPQIQAAVDAELDEAFRGGADDDPAAG